VYKDLQFQIARERYQAMLREAESQRMVKETQGPRPENNPILARVLLGIGLAMVRASRRMQRAHGELSHQAFDPCAQIELGIGEF
jgi:hypothetical protein